ESAEPVRRRHAEAIEVQAEGAEPVVADLVDRRPGEPGGKAPALLLDEERDEPAALRLAGRGIGLAREQDDEVGIQRVAAPALLAPHDVLVADALGAALDVGEVGPGIRLGEGGRADPLPARTAPEEGGPSVRIAHLRPEAVAARDDARDAHPRARELLRDERVLEDALAHAAVLGV